MDLVQALIEKGYDECIDEEISSMVERVKEGEDPSEVLLSYGLDADYEMDLLEYLM